jgi:hypothetical protein
MVEQELIRNLTEVLEPLGAKREPGEQYRTPELDVLLYWTRGARLSRLPFFGRLTSIVALVREPSDLTNGEHPERVIGRVCQAANSRFPPIVAGRGLAACATVVLVTSGAISVDEEDRLDRALARSTPRQRVWPMGIFRVDLERECLSFAIRRVAGPGDVAPEPSLLAERLSGVLRRYAPPLSLDPG